MTERPRAKRRPFLRSRYLLMPIAGILAGSITGMAGLNPTVKPTARSTTTLLAIEPRLHEAPLLRAARLDTHAGGSLDLNVYELTDRVLERMLVRRARAGVRVRILLDPGPWHGARIVAAERRFCARHPRLACRMASHRFRFDHAKYAVFDDRYACIGTANWTWRAFHRNREYIVCTSQPRSVRAAAELFRDDWRGVPAGKLPRQALVVSPGAENRLQRLLRGSGPLAIEAEEVGSVKHLDRLIARHGARARILLPQRLSPWDRGVAQALVRKGVQIRLIHRPYLHAKLILTRTCAFIGSQNLTRTSLVDNREVGILIRAPGLLARLRRQFAKDWERSKPLPGSR